MTTQEALFKLLRIALGKEEPSAFPDDVNWQEVYHLSLKQGVGAIACDGLYALPECNIDEDLRYMWLGQSMVIEQKYQNYFNVANKMAGYFSQNQIKTYVLKGISFASYYPVPHHRSSSDLDICLLSDFENGNQLMEKSGVAVDRSESKHSHFTVSGVHVENHQFCIGGKGSQKEKNKERLFQRLLSQGSDMIEGSILRRPIGDFNALFCMYHARTHFLVEEGITLKHVCDWIVLRNKISEDFWKECEELGLTKFAVSLDNVAGFVSGDDGVSLTREGQLMLDAILSTKEHESSSSKTMARIHILKMIWNNRLKYRYYSDTNPIKTMISYIWGHLFEKNPQV